jgi:hypothetical protein
MSRATLAAALIRIDALIARIHNECIAEATAIAFAPHHDGCILHESHGGDCVIHRPRKPRYVIAQGGR